LTGTNLAKFKVSFGELDEKVFGTESIVDLELEALDL
jgi:hypothetical protein